MTIAWDTTLLPFQSVMFSRRNLSRSGGLTISGTEQVVQSSSDFWESQVTIKIRNKEQTLAYRAYQAQNWGRAGQWLIPTCSTAPITVEVPPTPVTGGDFGPDFGPDFSRGGTGGSTGVAAMLETHGVVNAMAVKGSLTLSCHFSVVGAPAPLSGMYFSIGSRLYLIGTVSGGPINYAITFIPKLRADAIVGTVMEFSRPHCLMRLAQDNIGQMNLDMLRFADVSLNFVEIPT
jgi:hypothetical protein